MRRPARSTSCEGPLDTPVFIAGEGGHPLPSDRLPDEAAISVVTLAELELGVHMAASEAARGRRLRTLQTAWSTYVAAPGAADSRGWEASPRAPP